MFNVHECAWEAATRMLIVCICKLFEAKWWIGFAREQLDGRRVCTLSLRSGELATVSMHVLGGTAKLDARVPAGPEDGAATWEGAGVEKIALGI